MASDALEQPVDLSVELEVLEHTEWSNDEVETSLKLEAGDITNLDGNPVTEASGRHLLASDTHHRLREVQALHGRAVGCQRDGYASGATPELENPGPWTWKPPYVERNVPRKIRVEVIELGWLCTRVSHRSVSPDGRGVDPTDGREAAAGMELTTGDMPR